MLGALGAEGVTHVMATPHFYADRMSVDAFLEKREEAFSLLSEAREDAHPAVLCGAEVAYYPGISQLDRLSCLAPASTRLLLLEMPFTRWTEYVLGEVRELARTRNLVPVLAHVEQYLSFGNERALIELCKEGILAQANASFWEAPLRAHHACRLMRKGCVQLLGSDAHNMTNRPPRLRRAYWRIEKAFGAAYVSEMKAFGARMLGIESR